ncbi:Maf family protein [Oceanicoccus sagamiensis]|uniref:dTTP/UTP pyrophosphatase n=1 Tax=Oceanicoccus sagamiensis TaxID=716816 RepID=A0A1X9NDE5_9GAMM|nr:nucleoside triphosphate pyrophosphatase [Oceanicoccus sagamiensis]ARN72977.1 septum formation protein Maf [Oceanicoccus sagamiensis]
MSPDTANKARLYLASQSPRRAELLEQVALGFEKISVDTDESVLAGESPQDYVQRVAIAKAQAGLALVEQQGLSPLPVLGADTSVIIDGQILGKPRDRDHALAMLGQLSGSTHQVMSAICLCYQQCQETALSITRVSFRHIEPDELEQYWLSGEPLGKAGAYAIQGRGALFVENIEGSYSAVVGLPLLETGQLLQKIEQLEPYE